MQPSETPEYFCGYYNWCVNERRIDVAPRQYDSEGRLTRSFEMVMKIGMGLMHIARRRLCYQASRETREVVVAIKEAIREVDPDLSHFMVPNCVYRGGICPEPKPCGNYSVRRYGGEDDMADMVKKVGRFWG